MPAFWACVFADVEECDCFMWAVNTLSLEALVSGCVWVCSSVFCMCVHSQSKGSVSVFSCVRSCRTLIKKSIIHFLISQMSSVLIYCDTLWLSTVVFSNNYSLFPFLSSLVVLVVSTVSSQQEAKGLFVPSLHVLCSEIWEYYGIIIAITCQCDGQKVDLRFFAH